VATLVYSDVDGIDRTFAIGPEPIVVGRGQECAIRSDDPRVSRMHARFYVAEGALWVEDLGSSNGIYVGPNKVTRAPVPTGEIVVIGSLMIRLLPASGTLPPPMGLHGTLAQWLEMERKARAGIEDERDAFAKRVGDLHQELAQVREAVGAHGQDATQVRDELDKLRRQSATEAEQLRLDLAKAREAKMMAETQAGITTAERLAESDMTISGLQAKVQQLEAAAAHASPRADADQIAGLTARAEKAEKELAAEKIRAQGAERNVSGAATSAAKAETRASEAEHELAEAVTRRAALETELAAARDKAAALETRLGAGDAPVQAAEARAAKIAGELAELQQQFETRKDRIAELEKQAVEAVETDQRAKQELASLGERLASLADKLAAEQTRANEAEARLRALGAAEAEISAAKREREEAKVRAQTADSRVAEASTRVEDAEQRARAADTMAKSMAKDVAEALRRAVDADTRARTVARELDGAHRRAEAAEKRDAERQLATRELDKRATEAEAKLAAVQTELGGKLEQAQRELGEKAEAADKELRGKLEQAQRELAAERQTAMALVDRKTQLERELSEVRTQLAGVQHRVELAEGKNAEYEAQLEVLEDKVQDLEAGVAVEQTASQSAVGEAKERVDKLEAQLAEAKAAAKTAVKTAAGLEKRIDGLEDAARAHAEGRQAAEAALTEARARIAELEPGLARLDEVEQHARDSAARLEPLQAKADAADLAIGRASAVQRQLDEALQKLSWMERDLASAARTPRPDEQRQDPRIEAAELHAREVEARAKEIEARAKETAERIVETERRARDVAGQLAEAQARLGEDQQQIAALKKEVDAAENVRSFAAATEREIAQFQRELRETKAKLAQITLERDNFESQLRDARDDSETRDRSLAPMMEMRGGSSHDPEVTTQADLSRYTALVSRTTELEVKLTKAEKDQERMRRELADAEARAAAQRRASEDEPTNTGSAVPLEFAEHLSVLEEAIDSLRANMRAASDETAMMDQTESVVVVANAVSSAAEHVERARDSLRALTTMVTTS
jgi:chromosome segregation ATPase